MNSSNQNNNTDHSVCQIEEALNFLKQLEIFRNAPLDILKLYAYLSKKEQYSENQAILSQGTRCDRMYLIMKGEVTICEKYHDKHYQMQILTAGDLNYFGEMALIAKFNWFFSAWAKTDVSLLSISREAFQKVMERYPQAYPKAVEKIVTLRIDRFADQMNSMMKHADTSNWPKCTFDTYDTH